MSCIIAIITSFAVSLSFIITTADSLCALCNMVQLKHKLCVLYFFQCCGVVRLQIGILEVHLAMRNVLQGNKRR